MVGRPRCSNCKHAFTPNYRNRTKKSGRQRVCPDCGPIIGHRQADKRYRESAAVPRRRRPKYPATSRSQPAMTVPAAVPLPSPALPSPLVGSASVALSTQVRRHLAAIAALVGGSSFPDGCDAFGPHPAGDLEKSSAPGHVTIA